MRINIYHTNDIHANFEFAGRLASYLKINKGSEDIYLDSGDFLDLKSLVVQADKGGMALDFFCSCQLDAMAVGNNEIDLGRDLLENLMARYEMLSANITDNQGVDLRGIRKSKIIKRANKRFLIIGLSPYYDRRMDPGHYNNLFMLGNIKSGDSFKAIEKELEENEGEFDHVILLSHSGYDVDRKIMERFPDIDLVLGGHSHQIVSSGRYSQSGRGTYLGKVLVDLDQGDFKIIGHEQIDLSSVEIDESHKKMIEDHKLKADKILSEEIYIVGELDFNPFRENALINFLCDCLQKEFGADFAIMHNGIAENGLFRPVSKKTLIENFPSKLKPTIYSIKGKYIKEAVLLSFDEDHIRSSGKGAGFRGSVLGSLSFSSNVRLIKKPFSISLNGEKLEDEKLYFIATDDYLQRGTGYWPMRVPDGKAHFHKSFIRDLLEKYLDDEEVFNRAKIKRISY